MSSGLTVLAGGQPSFQMPQVNRQAEIPVRARFTFGPEALLEVMQQLAQQSAQQGDGQSDDIGRIAVDAINKGGAQSVEREGASNIKRLATGQISQHFVIVRVAEANGR